MSAPRNLLYEAAFAWKKLTEYRYIFTYGYKKQLHIINLTFSIEDFPHLAGFQYLNDLFLPRYNSSKIVDKVLDYKIQYEQIVNGSRYLEMVKPRLEALVQLQTLLENEFFLFSFKPQMYPFTTKISADFLISSHTYSENYIFILQQSTLSNLERNYLCCSIFKKGIRNYETNQRQLALLKKERLHIPTDVITILFQKSTAED